MYGLDSFVLEPPLSAIVSLMLIIACDGLGVYISKYFGLQVQGANWLRWQAPIFGALFLSILLYPFALLGFATLEIFRIIAIVLIAFSLFHLFLSLSKYRNFLSLRALLSFAQTKNYRFWPLLLGFLLLSFGVYALSPITNADSLNYHVGVSLHILRTGSIPVTPEWFHSRLTGNGEVLNAIGFAIGAEQFGSLLQFAGLLGIVGLIYNAEADQNGANRELQQEWRVLLAIIAASSPILVFLVGSVKPQLLPIAMTTLAAAITIYPSRRNLSIVNQLKGFLLVSLLVMAASQAKFNYLLGGGVVGLIALIAMHRRHLFIPSAGIGLLSALLILVPPAVWKMQNFGGSFIEALLTPLPGNWPGTDKFEAWLRTFRDSLVDFPFSLIIPSGVGTITTVLGLGVLFFLFLKPKGSIWLWAIIIGAVVVASITASIGPAASRSYLEPYFWLLIVLAMQPLHSAFIKYKNWFKLPILLQSGLVIAICWYGIITTVPGAVSSSFRTNVMMRMANGYDTMQWVDKILPQKAVLLIRHRSMALSPRRTVSLDWVGFVHFDSQEPMKYLDRIKEEKVTHLLLMGENYTDSGNYNLFLGCLGKRIIGPGPGHLAARNPFNMGKEFKVWLIPFKSELLPECFVKGQ
ncbi:MAG: DUF1420 family protein [SAR324 cluster bacterium]|nr:DUF1420 family protein [SAR324 cluster bacterium]